MKIRKHILVVAGTNYPNIVFLSNPGFNVEFISAQELKHHNLLRYIAVIIAYDASDIILSKRTDILKKYINKGGILVCLGCHAYNAQWIPYCKWEPGKPTNANWINKEDDYNDLFYKINKPEFLIFHEFCCDGTLVPPPNSKILAEADSQPMMCIIEDGIKGVALLTTLDPDNHVLRGIAKADKTNEKEQIETARQLINNIFSWCLKKYEKKHSVGSYCLRGCQIITFTTLD